MGIGWAGVSRPDCGNRLIAYSRPTFPPGRGRAPGRRCRSRRRQPTTKAVGDAGRVRTGGHGRVAAMPGASPAPEPGDGTGAGEAPAVRISRRGRGWCPTALRPAAQGRSGPNQAGRRCFDCSRPDPRPCLRTEGPRSVRRLGSERRPLRSCRAVQAAARSASTRPRPARRAAGVSMARHGHTRSTSRRRCPGSPAAYGGPACAGRPATEPVENLGRVADHNFLLREEPGAPDVKVNASVQRHARTECAISRGATWRPRPGHPMA